MSWGSNLEAELLPTCVRLSEFHPQHHTQETSGSEGPMSLACGTREDVTAATGWGGGATPGKVNSESSASPTKALGGGGGGEQQWSPLCTGPAQGNRAVWPQAHRTLSPNSHYMLQSLPPALTFVKPPFPHLHEVTP